MTDLLLFPGWALMQEETWVEIENLKEDTLALIKNKVLTVEIYHLVTEWVK